MMNGLVFLFPSIMIFPITKENLPLVVSLVVGFVAVSSSDAIDTVSWESLGWDKACRFAIDKKNESRITNDPIYELPLRIECYYYY